MNVQLLLDLLFNLMIAGGAAYLYFDKARQTLRDVRRWLTAKS